MLKGFRLICVLLSLLSIVLQTPLSKLSVCSLNVSNIRNAPGFRQPLREEQTGMPILFNQTLDYIIPRRRLLGDSNPETNHSSTIENSTKLDGSVHSNTFIDLNKDNNTFTIKTTWAIEPFTTLSTISIDIESFSSTPEPEEDVTHVRRKRNALMDQNRSKYEEEKERKEKIDKKRSSVAEKNEKISSIEEEDEISNAQNSEDGELDDYNALNEKSSEDAEEPNENEENLEEEDEEASQEETASREKDAKMKRESSDYEYAEDQENSSDNADDEKKTASDVRVKRDEAESAKRANENVDLEDNSLNDAGNLETGLKEDESSGKLVAAENQDSKIAAIENRDTKNEEMDAKRDALKNKTDSTDSSKECALSTNDGKSEVKAGVSSETDNDVIDAKSKDEERGTRTASSDNDDYEKRVEEQIKRKIDSIKEEIKREIERKQRDREIERNNAKFDELQSRDADQEEEENLEAGQSLEEGLPSKRSSENSKDATAGKRRRRSNENELTRRKLEEIEGVENLKDEDYRLASLTHQSIQKRFAPVYNEVSKELEEKNKIVSNKAPVKKREKVRQIFIVKDDGKQRRKKRGEVREARGAKGVREAKEAKEARKAREVKGAREARAVKGAREARDAKGARKAKEATEVRIARGAKSVREAKKAKEARETREARGHGKRRRTAAKQGQILVPEQARVKIEEELPRDLTLDPRLRRSLPFNNGKQSQTDPLALPAKDSNRRLVTDYNEAFGGLQSLRDNPNGALARFKRIKRVLNASSSRNS
ncbi:hypothetical protein KPH14_010775 [Odynerus spinipes]|uniref:Uncharacterized protein n=1 Tax=Odynerus spinipes TaxID=1348599 RepID=A0AAD9RGX2_9HYME|nr:hypothetical protein KPH14_010775 [Odynerus spinipes]